MRILLGFVVVIVWCGFCCCCLFYFYFEGLVVYFRFFLFCFVFVCLLGFCLGELFAFRFFVVVFGGVRFCFLLWGVFVCLGVVCLFLF